MIRKLYPNPVKMHAAIHHKCSPRLGGPYNYIKIYDGLSTYSKPNAKGYNVVPYLLINRKYNL